CAILPKNVFTIRRAAEPVKHPGSATGVAPTNAPPRSRPARARSTRPTPARNSETARFAALPDFTTI
ncbi:MAG: hypothetical protein AVDCRST_MAG04-2559, partial [uncultured Acetobacteraceae bacterium]